MFNQIPGNSVYVHTTTGRGWSTKRKKCLGGMDTVIEQSLITGLSVDALVGTKIPGNLPPYSYQTPDWAKDLPKDEITRVECPRLTE